MIINTCTIKEIKNRIPPHLPTPRCPLTIITKPPNAIPLSGSLLILQKTWSSFAKTVLPPSFYLNVCLTFLLESSIPIVHFFEWAFPRQSSSCAQTTLEYPFLLVLTRRLYFCTSLSVCFSLSLITIFSIPYYLIPTIEDNIYYWAIKALYNLNCDVNRKTYSYFQVSRASHHSSSLT